MHEVLLGFAYHLIPHVTLADGSSDTAGQVKVALITGGFLLAGTIFTTFAPKRGDGSDKVLAAAQKNLEGANRRAERAERRNETLSTDNDRMRDLLNLYDKDPNEDPDEVRRRLQHG